MTAHATSSTDRPTTNTTSFLPRPSQPIQIPSSSSTSTLRPAQISTSPTIQSPNSTGSPQLPQTPWWADRDHQSRPWQNQNTGKRRKTIPQEQTEAFNKTATAVSKATGIALRAAGDIAHEALILGADVLQFAPVAGLSEAAKVLLSIWDAVEQVETNRLACLGLTERCADILRTVHEEVLVAGGEVTDTLRAPVQKLTDTFIDVEHLVQKQAERPFLKRYLKRDDISTKIQACHAKLTDAVSMFSITIQIRMLQRIQEAEVTRRHDNAELTALLELARHPDATQVIPTIQKIRRAQFDLDSRRDQEDLLQTMRTALSTSNDTAVLDVLQVQKHEIPEAVKAMQRALEDPAQTSDTFHKEFIEGGIEAMQRLSGDYAKEPLPSWTITRWEVDREEQIGVGFFADVYKATYKGFPVAVKILAATTPAKMFLHEVEIWKSLKHENVLQLYGASSTASNPPFFFVSPYMKNGSLVTFLKQFPDIVNPLQMIREIAVGMDYLHNQNVLHGDLKACNVLMDDKMHCQITDFGQSEMKNEAYRLSGNTLPTKGTLRWLAPEAITGLHRLTPAIDVWAFAITCIEILTNGDLPWPNLDDQMVWHLVVVRDQRPAIPPTHQTNVSLVSLIQRCWAREPDQRPLFRAIASEVALLVKEARGSGSEDTPRPSKISLPVTEVHASPSLRPVELGDDVPPPWSSQDLLDIKADVPLSTSVTSEGTLASYKTAEIQPWTIPVQHAITPNAESPPPAPHTPLRPPSPAPSETGSEMSSEATDTGHDSPAPLDPRVAARRDERRYRLNLEHGFHPSLVLPLWSPMVVALGDVGYLLKPSGRFVSLFNAFNPQGIVAPLRAVATGIQRRETRTMAQRGLDMIKEGFLTFRSHSETYSTSVARRYSFPVRAGHRRAILVAETTQYRYMDNLEAPKAWFSANIDHILRLYGQDHNLTKGDIFLVLGSLQAQDWGIFVNHSHPDGNVHFNVFSERHVGREWGVFSTDTHLSTDGGPRYQDRSPTAKLSANKVSIRKEAKDAEWVSLILARLRFKPDVLEPTSH